MMLHGRTSCSPAQGNRSSPYVHSKVQKATLQVWPFMVQSASQIDWQSSEQTLSGWVTQTPPLVVQAVTHTSEQTPVEASQKAGEVHEAAVQPVVVVVVEVVVVVVVELPPPQLPVQSVHGVWSQPELPA